MRTRTLITGSEGFIGSHLKEALPDADCLDLVLGTDIRTCELEPGYDTIYHVAANASIPESFSTPVRSHDHNVSGTIRILEHARYVGAKVIFSSSSSVKEMMSPYALQKKQCEDYMKLYWELGVKSVALRYFNVYGERQEVANGGNALALAKFLKQYKDKEPFTVVGTGEHRRDFIYVKDVVKANLEATEWLETAEEFKTFDVGMGKNHSINEVLDMIDIAHPRVGIPNRMEPFQNRAVKRRWLPNWKPTQDLKEWINSVK